MVYFEEEQIKHIVEVAAKRLGANATPQEVKNIVQQVVEKMDSPASLHSFNHSETRLNNSEVNNGTSRVILTAFGNNHPGVIASITKVLADYQCDIQDMTQKLMQEFFSLMIIFDMSNSNKDFDSIRDSLLSAGDAVGAKCLIQHEDIFKGMHRI